MANQRKKAEAFCNMMAAPIFSTSMFCAFMSLHKASRSSQFVNVVVSAILILITVPVFPWVVWELEYGGRVLKDEPNSTFLPKPLLWLVDKINVWKYKKFSQFNVNLYLKVFARLPPFKWIPNWDKACRMGATSIDSLVDAGKYANPDEESNPPLTKQGLVNINTGVLYNMLYTMLVGINLLSAVTHFGFYGNEFARAGGCPFSMPRGILVGTCTGGSTSVASTSASTLSMILSSKVWGIALRFLGALTACLAASTFWGMGILTLFDAFPLKLKSKNNTEMDESKADDVVDSDDET